MQILPRAAQAVYFARVSTGSDSEQLRAKTILLPGAEAAEVVAKGEAELGIRAGV